MVDVIDDDDAVVDDDADHQDAPDKRDGVHRGAGRVHGPRNADKGEGYGGQYGQGEQVGFEEGAHHDVDQDDGEHEYGKKIRQVLLDILEFVAQRNAVADGQLELVDEPLQLGPGLFDVAPGCGPGDIDIILSVAAVNLPGTLRFDGGHELTERDHRSVPTAQHHVAEIRLAPAILFAELGPHLNLAATLLYFGDAGAQEREGDGLRNLDGGDSGIGREHGIDLQLDLGLLAPIALSDIRDLRNRGHGVDETVGVMLEDLRVVALNTHGDRGLPGTTTRTRASGGHRDLAAGNLPRQEFP